MKIKDWLTISLAVIVIAAVLVGVGVVVVKYVIPAGPSTPEPPSLTMEKINKAAFIEYHMAIDVQHAEIPDNILKYLGVKDEILALVYGKVVGGFDLKEMQKDSDIQQNGTEVFLKLPPPKVLYVELDPKKSYVVYHNDTCPGFFGCKESLDVFLNDMEPKARERMTQEAIEYGLLKQTAEEGKEYYESFLKSLGFTKVYVVVDGYIY